MYGVSAGMFRIRISKHENPADGGIEMASRVLGNNVQNCLGFAKPKP